MAEHLIIRLLDGARGPAGNRDAAEWVVVDDAGACVLAPGAGTLADAAGLASGRRVIVLAGAARVLRLHADVPVRGSARIAQALPFALEDMLADDVEDLHFASGPAAAGAGGVPVAVVRHDVLRDWLARLGDAGIAPQALYADSDGIVDIPGTTTLLIESHQAVLREPGGDIIVTEPDPDAVLNLLELWVGRPPPMAADGALPPRQLLVYDATVDGWPPESWEPLRTRLASIDQRRLADGALTRLAAAVVTTPGVNLLQGEYAGRSSLAGQWRHWRLPAALAACTVLALLAVTAADWWRLHREADHLEAAIAEGVAYTFPGAGAEASARDLVDARLRTLGTDTGRSGQDFLPTLRSVAEAIRSTGDAKLETMNYRSGVMELQVQAPSADTLDKIRRLVTQTTGLTAEIQSANAEGDRIQGRIRITTGGA